MSAVKKLTGGDSIRMLEGMRLVTNGHVFTPIPLYSMYDGEAFAHGSIIGDGVYKKLDDSPFLLVVHGKRCYADGGKVVAIGGKMGLAVDGMLGYDDAGFVRSTEMSDEKKFHKESGVWFNASSLIRRLTEIAVEKVALKTLLTRTE